MRETIGKSETMHVGASRACHACVCMRARVRAIDAARACMAYLTTRRGARCGSERRGEGCERRMRIERAAL